MQLVDVEDDTSVSLHLLELQDTTPDFTYFTKQTRRKMDDRSATVSWSETTGRMIADVIDDKFGADQDAY